MYVDRRIHFDNRRNRLLHSFGPLSSLVALRNSRSLSIFGTLSVDVLGHMVGLGHSRCALAISLARLGGFGVFSQYLFAVVVRSFRGLVLDVADTVVVVLAVVVVSGTAPASNMFVALPLATSTSGTSPPFTTIHTGGLICGLTSGLSRWLT